MAETLNTPSALSQPIAQSGDKNTIPVTNDQSLGLMSQSTGFPPITSTRIANGGKAPRRADFNGAFNLLSQQHYFFQNGGTETFRQEVSDAIGGYPLNARLWYLNENGESYVLRSTKANNTDNFLTNPSVIGDSWVYDITTTSYVNSKINEIRTNCITDIPQLVNLSLTNGTITITDTTVVIPYGTSAPTYNVGQSLHGGTITDISWDGAKLFYYVKYATLTRTFTTTETSDNMFLFVNTSNNILTINGTVTSGASQPEGIQYAFWYDTVNNKIKFITGSYIAEDYDTCFPIARLSTNGSIVSRINQVFQSIGYIGTFAWIGKGVKGLCPNGRNKDGSLNNTIKVNNSISTSTSLYPNRVNEFKMERADGWVQGQGSYDEDENIILDVNGDKVVGFDVFAYSTNSEGQVTSFNPKTAFRAVDYYDFKNFNNTINSTKANVDLSNCTKPYVIASYRSGSSWYRQWSDGICEQGGYHAYSGNSGTATVTLLIPYTEYTTGSTTPSYSVLTNVAGTESYYNVVSVIKERTGESFVVMYASSASESANVSGFYWQATGYTTWGL